MEQNMPVIAKKVWSLVRVMFYMLKRGLSKGKFMAEFNMMLKRGKIAGKALQNLMLHHHHAWSLSTFNRRTHVVRTPPPSFPSPPQGEYEFSCSNSPANNYPLSLFTFHKKYSNNHSHFFSCAHAPKTDEQQEMVSVNAAVMKALEMLHSEAASPALPGFGKSPKVRQLRITDSPYPLQGAGGDEDHYVDEAAEEFIMKFYNELRRQSIKSPFSRH